MIPGAEPVARRVGALDGLLGAVDDLDRGDRAERLVRASSESAGTSASSVAWKHGPDRLATGEHPGAGGDGVVDPLLHDRERLGVDQRPDDRVRLLRVAGLERRRLGGEPRDELVGDRRARR